MSPSPFLIDGSFTVWSILWHWILTVRVPIGPLSLVWSLAVGLGFGAATVAPFVGSA